MVSLSWLSRYGFIFALMLVDVIHLTHESTISCPTACTCLQRVVDCLHGNLTSVPSRFPFAQEIENLNLARNRIKNITHELDAYAELRFLSLVSNNVSSIASGAFGKLVHLKTLLLTRNFVTKIDQFLLEGLSSLQHLDLGYNALRILTPNSFRDMVNLLSLDLTRNKISLIELGAFRGLRNLEVVNLTRNNLDIFPVTSFRTLVSLRMLVLDDNHIPSLPARAFSDLHHLEYLSLSGNRLQTVDEQCFMASTGEPIPLKTLYMRGAHIQMVPDKVLHGIKTLEQLDLSQSKIRVLRNTSLAGATGLKYFTLTSSKSLTSVEHAVFSDMDGLVEVVISGNRFLTNVNNISFSASKHLQKLDLSENSLSTFSRFLIDWTSDVEVNLRGNSFRCDCNLSWLPQVLPLVSNNLTLLLLNHIMCSSPAGLNSRRIATIPSYEFHCAVPNEKMTLIEDVTRRAKVAAIAAGVGCVTLVVFAIVLKFKKQICMLIHRQYRYGTYKSTNGVLGMRRGNDDVLTPEEMTPMDDLNVYMDDVTTGPDVKLVTSHNCVEV